MRACTTAVKLPNSHAAAAAGAGMLWCLRLIGVGVGCFDSINWDYWEREQLACARDVPGTHCLDPY